MNRLLICAGLIAINVSFFNQACQSECKFFCGNDTTINRMSQMLYNFGTALENVKIPVFEKLGNILPYGVIAFCCKKFPRQTMFLCCVGFFHCLYRNRYVRNTLTRYGIVSQLPCKKPMKVELVEDSLEDSFFVFEDNDIVDIQTKEHGKKQLFNNSFDDSFIPEKSFKESVSFL